MILEIIGLAAAFGGTELVGKITNGRFPRPTYAALVGWWWGSFAEDSPGALLASMIDSDLNCDQWWIDHEYYYREYERVKYDIIKSDSFHASIDFHPKKGRCKLKLEDKSGNWSEHKVTAYEDYLLVEAKDRWKSRKVTNESRRVIKEHMDLVNERVNQNYMKTLDMIENRILNSDTEVTDPNLRALLPAPEPKVPQYELVDDGFRTYRKPIEIEHENRVKKKTKRRKELAERGVHDVW